MQSGHSHRAFLLWRFFPTSLVAKSGNPLSYIISRRRRHETIGHVVAGELRCIVGYVPLERAIFPRLTVEEN
jgi:hypothetical protein